MVNDFVILGPASDPARVLGVKDASVALSKIANTGSVFVSRGDASGTHKKELELWEKARVKPSGPWYLEVDRAWAPY